MWYLCAKGIWGFFVFLILFTLILPVSVMNVRSLYHEGRQGTQWRGVVSCREGLALRPGTWEAAHGSPQAAPGQVFSSPECGRAAVQKRGSGYEKRDGQRPVIGDKGQGGSPEKWLGSMEGRSLRGVEPPRGGASDGRGLRNKAERHRPGAPTCRLTLGLIGLRWGSAWPMYY